MQSFQVSHVNVAHCVTRPFFTLLGRVFSKHRLNHKNMGRLFVESKATVFKCCHRWL